jgi:hypothetical protein
LQLKLTELGNEIAVADTAPLVGTTVVQVTGMQVGMPVVNRPDVWHVDVALPLSR